MGSASTLVSVSNKLYSAIVTYNNTIGAQFDSMLSRYGLSDGITAEKIAAMDHITKATLYLEVLALYRYVITEAGNEAYETELSEGGYGGYVAAIADAANCLAGDALAAVVGNLTVASELSATLVSGVENSEVLNVTSKLAAMREALQQAATRVNRA